MKLGYIFNSVQSKLFHGVQTAWEKELVPLFPPFEDYLLELGSSTEKNNYSQVSRIMLPLPFTYRKFPKQC